MLYSNLNLVSHGDFECEIIVQISTFNSFYVTNIYYKSQYVIKCIRSSEILQHFRCISGNLEIPKSFQKFFVK